MLGKNDLQPENDLFIKLKKNKQRIRLKYINNIFYGKICIADNPVCSKFRFT